MINIINLNQKPKDITYINCARPTALGNPFKITTKVSRAEVCALYKDWFYNCIDEPDFLDYVDNTPGWLPPIMKQLLFIYRVASSGDINLACHCAPKQCHCETIKEFIELKLEESLK